MASEEQYQINPFDAPIPGQSLTNNPDNPNAWEKPPKFTNPEKAIQDLFMRITEEEVYPDLMDNIRDGVPIDQLTQFLVFKGYSQGAWNVDLMMLLIEPTMYLLIALAEHNGIKDYTLYKGEEEDMSEEEVTQFLKDDASRAAPKRSKLSVAMNKKAEDVLPGSLLSKVEGLPTTTEEEEGA